MHKKILLCFFVLLLNTAAFAESPLKPFPVPKLKSPESTLNVAVGERAPDFVLPSITGKRIRLSQYLGEKIVVLSFVPAAWTPVCSGQWPGYNLAIEMFEDHEAVVLGISVDNIPTLAKWSEAMDTLNFPVLSDFWPHGKVADMYGVLRSDGMTERALFVIDKHGIIRYIDVHDINTRPDLGELIHAIHVAQN